MHVHTYNHTYEVRRVEYAVQQFEQQMFVAVETSEDEACSIQHSSNPLSIDAEAASKACHRAMTVSHRIYNYQDVNSCSA